MGVGFEGLVRGGWLIGAFHAIHCIGKFVPVRCLGSGVRRYGMLLYAGRYHMIRLPGCLRLQGSRKWPF